MWKTINNYQQKTTCLFLQSSIKQLLTHHRKNLIKPNIKSLYVNTKQHSKIIRKILENNLKL